MTSLPELPVGWRWSTVADVGRIQLGRQRSPKNHTGTHMRPYLRVANVYEDRIDTSDVMEMNFTPEEFERYQLHPGDILLNEGQTPELLGRPALYRGHPAETAFTNSLIRFQAGEHVLPEWALIVFRHHMHSGRFKRECRITTNIAHLSASRFKSVEFPVPPLEKQRQIASRLTALREELDRASHALKKMKVRLAALEQRILFEVPAGIAVRVPLRELLAEPLRNGFSAATTEGGTGVPVYSISAVTQRDFSQRFLKPTTTHRDSVKDLICKAGDLFVQRSNTPDLVGSAALYNGGAAEAIFPDLLIRVRCNDKALPEWLELALKTPQSRTYLRERAQGLAGSMPKINQGTLLDLPVPLPPISDQLQLVERVGASLRNLQAARAMLSSLDKRLHLLWRAALTAAFQGDLVRHDPFDESAAPLLRRFNEERLEVPRTAKPRSIGTVTGPTKSPPKEFSS